MDVKNVVDWFILTNAADVKTNPLVDVLTPIKLMNLLYVAQGYHLAANDELLFSEPMTAWVFGAKVASVQRHFSGKREALDPFAHHNGVSAQIVDDDKHSREAVRAAYDAFWDWSTNELSEAVKKQTPWIEARAREDNVIDQGVLKRYFEQHVLAYG
ncbi:Panacea domain-containing protein [Schleiferilactobacillus shenzhenensis]|uniref:Antitoxin SocA-like Panacea domain-containing protein n=1 Tax=Schleiferilactobacillus shenzhenensis LY-73 TaxID=1231336 RepID=U4TM35_9LACO|nr:type II toxin-antitoxin system antitoxin SocA domain-containing protein [Schleiferilactobacillus shenzhenensis]ERL65269.1 hypothetical protein L248_2944 [Schleiferilactobacillus shenzhenensis LY-73]